MTLKTFLISISFLLASSTEAQQLVPNPGFEDYDTLPYNWGQWHLCPNWSNANGEQVSGFYADPDYFHIDGLDPVNLPSVVPAYVVPHNGRGIMAFLAYHDPSVGTQDIREYIMVELTDTLVIGENYTVSFWLTNGESGIGHYYKCDRIGVNLSTNPLDQFGTSYIDRAPQMEITGEVFTNEWTQYSFNFQADSAYTYLTIGNFYSDSQTSVSVALSGPLPFAGAYYFIDDVFLSASGNIGFSEENQRQLFSVYPVPTQDIITLSFENDLMGELTYSIYAVDGRLMKSGLFTETISVNVDDLQSGTYFVVVKSENEQWKETIILE